MISHFLNRHFLGGSDQNVGDKSYGGVVTYPKLRRTKKVRAFRREVYSEA